uniref:Uncharacterized protein n=1 Tax=Marseillevirus LCMAC101 TaxID=2506602 RepID=A0A481YSN2_9VIRU|nr:MAG: hypothetical protein LCMAC101_06640 [Marseillevirus LCMAC101]
MDIYIVADHQYAIDNGTYRIFLDLEKAKNFILETNRREKHIYPMWVIFTVKEGEDFNYFGELDRIEIDHINSPFRD